MNHFKTLLYIVVPFGITLIFQNCGQEGLSPREQYSIEQNTDESVVLESDLIESDFFPSGSKGKRTFRVSFNDHKPGLYKASQLEADFGSYAVQTNRGVSKGAGGEPLKDSEVRTEIKESNGNPFLRIHIPKNKIGPDDTGATWWMDLSPKNHMKIKFDLRFSKKFKSKGGKIMGLFGGSSTTGGTQANGKNGFSVRANWWRTENTNSMASYVYHVNPDQRPPYGNGFYWYCDKKSICSNGELDMNKIRGRWIKVELEVKLNTLGKENGFVRAKVNGKVVSEEKGLVFRTTKKLKIDNFRMNVFAGGDDNSYAVKKDAHIDIDNLSIWEL